LSFLIYLEGKEMSQIDVTPCEDDEHDWEFIDDSFDHEYGTERIHYWRCRECGITRNTEASDYSECEDSA
jgi:hypothetical protein